MKKIGLICLAVVLTLGIAGVGFGWWSETLEIGQNPVNTGDFAVEYIVLPHHQDYPRCIFASPYVPCRNFQPDPWDNTAHYDTTDRFSITGDPHKMWINLENMYPGASVQIIFAMQNMGTIPSKVTGCTITQTGGPSALWSALEGKFQVTMYDGATGHRVKMWPDKPEWASANTGWQSLDDLGQALVDSLDGAVMLPNYQLRFDLPDDEGEGSVHFRVLDAGNNIENTNVTFTIEFTAEPFNK